MKNSYFLLFVMSSLLLTTSCSNDDGGDTVPLPPQYPMKKLIEDGIMQLSETKKNGAVTFELGYRFKSFKNGKITSLGVRVPDNETYRVTLWNMDTEEILSTTQVQATSELLSFEDISPVDIQSGTNYFVSLNTNDYYRFNNNGNAIFPAETEDIIVQGYGTYVGSSQTIPTQFSTTAYLGVVDIKFVPNQ